MAIIPRNEAELNRLYEGVQELQAEAGRIAGVATEAAVGAATFEETAQAQIGRTEISPELARREREAVAGLMGVKPSLEKEFEGVAIDPTRLGNIVAGRMNSYLGQIQDIQDTRRSRKLRIDDLIKSGATKAQAKALTLQSTLEQKRDEARTKAGEFEFFFNNYERKQAEARETSRRAAERAADQKQKELEDQLGKIKIGDFYVSTNTGAFLNGVANPKNMIGGVRQEVESDLFNLGYGKDMPAPDWFRVGLIEEEGRNLDESYIQEEWSKQNNDILTKITASDSDDDGLGGPPSIGNDSDSSTDTNNESDEGGGFWNWWGNAVRSNRPSAPTTEEQEQEDQALQERRAKAKRFVGETGAKVFNKLGL